MSQNKPFRILLIDDQEDIHRDYQKILGKQETTNAAVNKAAADLFGDDPTMFVDWEGFELSSALQGQDGFELVQRAIEEGHPYSVAFVDIRMPPGWDGIETVRRIWEVDPEILIVICSAYSDYSWEDMITQLGRNDRFLILKKPFDNIEVRQCAMALTERWSVSRTDMLTGLLNRRAFHGHLQLEWNRSIRHEFPLACAMLDLDYFKRVNDTLGHQAGDLVIKTVADLLHASCRASDYVCRYGGEEMCVLLPHTDEEGAAAWAEHARQAIEIASIPIGDRIIHVTASFGITERLEGDDGVAQVMDRADQALMTAKKLGRNLVVRYSSLHGSEGSMHEVQQRSNYFQGVTARQIMTTPVASLQVNATAGEAASFFVRFRLNSAPVVDLQGKLVGILSEKDVIGILLDEDAWNVPVERIMQRTVVCYEEDAPVQAICNFLSRVAVRRVVIVRGGCPVGVVSRGSLLRWYTNSVAMHQPSVTANLHPSKVNRARLMEYTKAVAECATELSESISEPADDLVAPVIEGVAKLQELINDLSICSQNDNIPVIVSNQTYLQTPGFSSSDPLPVV
jgi:two-component system cell cycle response regulator